MPTPSNNLYKKIEELERIEPKQGDELTQDQKKIVESALSVLEKDLAQQRTDLSFKVKLNPYDDRSKRSIDSISYNALNIRHLKIKLGIKTSSDQGGQNLT